MLEELWEARKELSRPGLRSDLVPNGTRLTWENYLADVGLSRTSVHRWLEQYDPVTKKMREIEAPKEPSIEPKLYTKPIITTPEEDKKYEERKAKAFEQAKRDSLPRSNPEEFHRILDSFQETLDRHAEAEKATAHLRLSGLPQNSAQGIIFQNIEKYLQTISEPHQKLEAVHNLIKRLKEIANRLQRESVREVI
jgi:acyl-CoA reductase-like NAD-dependent aldehyde dehydrogenase